MLLRKSQVLAHSPRLLSLPLLYIQRPQRYNHHHHRTVQRSASPRLGSWLPPLHLNKCISFHTTDRIIASYIFLSDDYQSNHDFNVDCYSSTSAKTLSSSDCASHELYTKYSYSACTLCLVMCLNTVPFSRRALTIRDLLSPPAHPNQQQLAFHRPIYTACSRQVRAWCF